MPNDDLKFFYETLEHILRIPYDCAPPDLCTIPLARYEVLSQLLSDTPTFTCDVSVYEGGSTATNFCIPMSRTVRRRAYLYLLKDLRGELTRLFVLREEAGLVDSERVYRDRSLANKYFNRLRYLAVLYFFGVPVAAKVKIIVSGIRNLISFQELTVSIA